MCRQNSPVHNSGEEEITADESLLIYCKPVEFYNILYRRSLHNPTFLKRCLRYKIKAKQKRRLRAGIVVFNYRDCYNALRKTEVTEDFSCPFCLMQCASFKGLRFHLCASHDLFNFEFWVTNDYQAVNVSVKTDILRSENVADGVIPQSQTFFFCSRSRKRRPRGSVQNGKHANVNFLKLDSPEGIQNGVLQKDNDILSSKGENMSRASRSEKNLQNEGNGGVKFGPDHPSAMDYAEHVESSFNIPGASIAMPQSSEDPECSKSIYKSDPALPTKAKKLNADRSDSKSRMLLQKRQFFHSHRVQPMALEQVLSDRDSEDEVDDGVANLEDRRMLDDFVDVSKDEKQLMHLWNSFMRKQRVLADGHVPWACEAFSKHYAKELNSSRTLFWCWRLFMVKLWNHGLLDASTMNNCSIILESNQNGGSDSGTN
ncbi:putative transcription factor C2H2 family [Medicago truncatula]|nr:polycomb group protein EMBRYONIC FLOWER 2 isoform X1 [Medicago truncatula]RHN53785.1 putative transcription factor C2H2 family [Medicago truncatula]